MHRPSKKFGFYYKTDDETARLPQLAGSARRHQPSPIGWSRWSIYMTATTHARRVISPPAP